MTNERRFNDDEVAFILEQAAAAEQLADDAPQPADGTGLVTRGMTLQQLTDVARETGFSPEAVILAAGAVVRGDLVPTRQQRYAGLPIGVARTIDLEREISQTEWERLVVELRETLQARGVLR